MRIEFRKILFDMDPQLWGYGTYPTGYDTITKAQLEAPNAMNAEFGFIHDHVNNGKGTVLLSSFNKLLEYEPITQGATPLFSIINNNSVHHMSYILAITCLKRGKNKKKVIINFDQHYDYGSFYSGRPELEQISCGIWGYKYLSRPVPTGEEWIYMVIGVKSVLNTDERRIYNKACYAKSGSKNENYFFIEYSSQPGKYLSKTIFINNLRRICNTMPWLRAKTIWDLLITCQYIDVDGKLSTAKEYQKEKRTELNTKDGDLNLTVTESQAIEAVFNQSAVIVKDLDGNDLINNILLDIRQVLLKLKNVPGTEYSLDDVDVYITVDRDIMKGSNTSYGDGVLGVEQAREAIKKCIEYLNEKNACLLGFDITGLPIQRGELTAEQEGVVVDQAKADIAELFTAASNYYIPEEPVFETLQELFK